MTPHRSFTRRTLLAALASTAAVSSGWAQSYPSKPIRLVLPVGGGNATDSMARAVAERIREIGGQPAVVENRPGGDLLIATNEVMTAPPDGHSILLVSPGSMAISPLFVPAWPYKPQDIKPLAFVSKHAAVLVTSGASNLRSFADLMAAAQAPTGVNVGTYGPTFRLGLGSLARRTRANLVNIPYKAVTQVLTDVAAGSTTAGLVEVASTAELVGSGRLRALAVTGRQRDPALPQVPTIRELLADDFEFVSWIGFGVPAQTPSSVQKEAEALLLKAIRHSAVRQLIERLPGAEFIGGDARQFESWVASETDRFRAMKNSGFALQ